MPSQRSWKIAPHDRGFIADLTRALRVTPLLAQVLAARGYTTGAAAQTFLDKKLAHLHDPELLPGIPAAADRIVAAIAQGRKITVYGDYDVDGVTSTSLLWHGLQLAGGKVDYYIPSRTEEGYGLNREAVRQLHQEDPSRLLITVDCGISSSAEAIIARELGLELIITDHHQFTTPPHAAAVVVHPRLTAGAYPFGDLCGVGVAFKLAWAVCARLGDGKKASPRMKEFLLQALGLAAMGTIADVVPLVDENRVIVHYGLSTLRERASPGLNALLKVAGLADKQSLTAEDIAFAVAPRINAAGRLGQARLAVELLTTTNVERATQLATYVDELNHNRQTVERKIFKQAKELVEAHPDWQEAPSLVLAHEEWHPGVVGIVASRVAEHFERPSVLISLQGRAGLVQGSGRTFAGFDLHTAISACQGCLAGFGGHRAAAGVQLDPQHIEQFRESFTAAVAAGQFSPVAGRELPIDAEVSLSDVTVPAIEDLEKLGPFGAGNKRPVLAASQVRLAAPPKKMGEGQRHLSVTLEQGGTRLRGVAFGRGEWADELEQYGGPMTVCFQPVINRFQGRANAEVQLIDWQPAAVQTSVPTP